MPLLSYRLTVRQILLQTHEARNVYLLPPFLSLSLSYQSTLHNESINSRYVREVLRIKESTGLASTWRIIRGLAIRTRLIGTTRADRGTKGSLRSIRRTRRNVLRNSIDSFALMTELYAM